MSRLKNCGNRGCWNTSLLLWGAFCAGEAILSRFKFKRFYLNLVEYGPAGLKVSTYFAENSLSIHRSFSQLITILICSLVSGDGSEKSTVSMKFFDHLDAVNCAVEIQRDIAERNAKLCDNRKLKFRIGINLDDVIEEEGRIYGDGINIVARVESMAEAGDICISGRAYDKVANKLGLECENLGKY
jgi:hypothetical protein